MWCCCVVLSVGLSSHTYVQIRKEALDELSKAMYHTSRVVVKH